MEQEPVFMSWLQRSHITVWKSPKIYFPMCPPTYRLSDASLKNLQVLIYFRYKFNKHKVNKQEPGQEVKDAFTFVVSCFVHPEKIQLKQKNKPQDAVRPEIPVNEAAIKKKVQFVINLQKSN